MFDIQLLAMRYWSNDLVSHDKNGKQVTNETSCNTKFMGSTPRKCVSELKNMLLSIQLK